MRSSKGLFTSRLHRTKIFLMVGIGKSSGTLVWIEIAVKICEAFQKPSYFRSFTAAQNGYSRLSTITPSNDYSGTILNPSRLNHSANPTRFTAALSPATESSSMIKSMLSSELVGPEVALDNIGMPLLSCISWVGFGDSKFLFSSSDGSTPTRTSWLCDEGGSIPPIEVCCCNADASAPSAPPLSRSSLAVMLTRA